MAIAIIIQDIISHEWESERECVCCQWTKKGRRVSNKTINRVIEFTVENDTLDRIWLIPIINYHD